MNWNKVKGNVMYYDCIEFDDVSAASNYAYAAPVQLNWFEKKMVDILWWWRSHTTTYYSSGAPVQLDQHDSFIGKTVFAIAKLVRK